MGYSMGKIIQRKFVFRCLKLIHDNPEIMKAKNQTRMYINFCMVYFYSEMGTHSDGYVEQELLTTFVTCEGDLSDPQFNTKFARLLKQLQKLLLKGMVNCMRNTRGCTFSGVVKILFG